MKSDTIGDCTPVSIKARERYHFFPPSPILVGYEASGLVKYFTGKRQYRWGAFNPVLPELNWWSHGLVHSRASAPNDDVVRWGALVSLKRPGTSREGYSPAPGVVAWTGEGVATSSWLPTQTSPPSKNSFFHMGTICLTRSTQCRQAANESFL